MVRVLKQSFTAIQPRAQLAFSPGGLLEEHIKKLRYGPFDPSKTMEAFFGLTEQQAEEVTTRNLPFMKADSSQKKETGQSLETVRSLG